LLLINKLQPKISYTVAFVWTGRASPKISNDLNQCCNACKHYRKKRCGLYCLSLLTVINQTISD